MSEQIESLVGDCDTRAAFVSLLKDNSVVLKKSMLPAIQKAKEKAWVSLARIFSINTGREITVNQLKKLLNNMKSSIKKKADVNTTGNKPIKLLAWEKDFMKLLQADENPTFCKVTGALCVGLETDIPSSSKCTSVEDEIDGDLEEVETRNQNEKTNAIDQSTKKVVKKRRLTAETKETEKLTTGQLQRLLLLEQIKLTRLQSQREQMLINEMEKKNGNFQEQPILVLEEENVLHEFVVLNKDD